MFVINEDLSIEATRGDIVFFTVQAKDDTGSYYEFQAGDVLRMKIYGKKNAENVLLEKDFPITTNANSYVILLNEEDTKIGPVISKPTDYWYEIELNPYTNPQTIIGYDFDGAKIFKLYPEGADSEVIDPDPEDIPIVDDLLDMTSTRPVQNQAIARAIVNLEAAFRNTESKVTEQANTASANVAEIDKDLATERARIDNLVAGGTAGDSELIDVRVAADGKTYSSAGTSVRSQVNSLKNRAIAYKDYSIASICGDVITPYCELGDIFYNSDNGTIIYRDTKSRIRTDFMTLLIGSVISLTDYTDGQFYLIKKKNGVYSLVSWRTSDYLVTDDADYAVVVSNINEVEHGDITSLASLLRVDVQGVYENLYETVDYTINFADMANVAIDTEGVEKASNIRKTSDYLYASAGDILTTHTLPMAVYEWSLEDKSFITKNDGWVYSYAVQNDCYIRVMLNTASGATIDGVHFARGKMLKSSKINNAPSFYEAKRYTDSVADKTLSLSNWRNNWFYDISHRGYMQEAPESTVAAFVRAKLHGYNAVEGDIRVTSDGQFVVHHNGNMPSDAEYYIADHTLDELRANANMGTYNGITQQILTFDEWMKLCKHLDMFAFVEHKVALTEEQIAELIRIASKNGMSDRVAWIATVSVAKTFRKYDTDCYLAIMNTNVDTVAQFALEHKPERSFIYCISTDITADLVEALANVNIGAVAWLVVYSWSMPGSSEDEVKAEIKRAIDCGINGICLDKWSAADIYKEEYSAYI